MVASGGLAGFGCFGRPSCCSGRPNWIWLLWAAWLDLVALGGPALYIYIYTSRFLKKGVQRGAQCTESFFCAGPLLVLVCRGASPSLIFPSATFLEDGATKPQDSHQISLKLPKIPRDNPKRPLGKDCAVNPPNVFGIISKQRSERIPQIIGRSCNEFSILLSFTFL